MDEESLRLSSALSGLRIETNPHHPLIQRLPSETLEAVFIQCVRDYFHEHDGLHFPTGPGWINISYVCQRWRNVALDCSNLWSYIVVMSPRWTEELLARSKLAPLKLKIYMRTRWGSHFVRQVMNHVERIQELFADIWSHEMGILSLLSAPAPRLKVLELWSAYSSRTMPEVFFGGDTPALRSLVLFNCPTSWYSLNLSRLTELRLSALPLRFRQNVPEFLDTLSRMQDLAHLYLSEALLPSAGFSSSVGFCNMQRINLPHLSSLLVVEQLSTVVALLSCINIPLKTTVKLRCRLEHDVSLDDHATFYSLLSQRIYLLENHAPSPVIRSLIIASSKSGIRTKITLSPSDRDCEAFTSPVGLHSDCDTPLQIILPFDKSTTKSERDLTISRFCCSIPLSNVQRLHVIHPPLSMPFWTDILGHLEGLRYIKLGQGHMPDLASVLSSHRDPSENMAKHHVQRRHRILAPALEELELYEIAFSKASKGNKDSLGHADIQFLCDVFSTRREHRAGLTMTRCTKIGPDGEQIQFDLAG